MYFNVANFVANGGSQQKGCLYHEENLGSLFTILTFPIRNEKPIAHF